MENLIVSSPCFKHEELIPIEQTGYGADRSPELVLSGLREDAISIAIIMNDMRHPIPAFNEISENSPTSTGGEMNHQRQD